MKIAFAKINQTVGDITGNTEKILRYIKNANLEKCDLIVFPKFSVSGGYCGYLDKNRDFIKEVKQIEQKILPQKHYKNISVIAECSPYYEGKVEDIKNRIKNFAIKNKKDVVYINMLGGHDGYVFDGLALYVDKTGKIKFIDRSFEEKLIIIDTKENYAEKTQIDREQELYDTLVFGFKDYMRKNGFKKAVLGISGGIDSALTAAIAVDALGAKNVLGVLLPSKYTSKESNKYALDLCKNLKMQTKIVPIKKLYNAYMKEFAPIFKGMPKDLTEENLQARIRSNILMALSN
ncbi:MAG: NAD(+) synthase, partial [Elusimicrobia bacterium]|nr:NAD(+) synthase [Elusimicrobiota bacterium]